MKVVINQEPTEFDTATTTVLEALPPAARKETSLAIAVNGEIVSRSEWATHQLQDGDEMDVVRAVSGGEHEDGLTIAGVTFDSRLFVGTGKYPTAESMVASLAASETELVTVAIRFMNLNGGDGDAPAILEHLDLTRYRLLPNTAGAYTVKDAVKMARLAREATGTNWIKLEVIGDQRTLWPDVVGTTEATRILVEEGFVVLPYTSPDLVSAIKLERAGAATVMPLASPIGSGQGVQDWAGIKRIIDAISVPVVVDAGIGTASDAALAMELGADAVLVNTAIARAGDPVRMATAMKLGTRAGREAFRAGRMGKTESANASSPVVGVPVASAAIE